MGGLLKTFTFDRNTFRRTTLASSESIMQHLQLVQDAVPLDKTQSNVVGAMATYMGLFNRSGNGIEATQLASSYRGMYADNPEDAWRWLATRSLWKYVVPNGTNTNANAVAAGMGISFSLFHLVLGVLTHLQALPDEQRFLYFDELLVLLDNDQNWSLSPSDFFVKVIQARTLAFPLRTERRSLLEDLEVQYEIPRDNLNTFFNKSLLQTGLFEYLENKNKKVGIALVPTLNPVLQRRVRFILDHPAKWNKSQESWFDFIQSQTLDMPVETAPVEIERRNIETAESAEEGASPSLADLLSTFRKHLAQVNLQYSEELVARFVCSLLAKQFLILTGLSGSGKTKLAQAFASWMGQSQMVPDCFYPGATFVSDRITYTVHAADRLSVEFWNSTSETDATKVVLPRQLIAEWADAISNSGFDRSISARTIREAVGLTTQFSTQLNSFETHLKVAAFAFLDTEAAAALGRTYEIVAVGPDWMNRDQLLGYPDALTPTGYVRTVALDLLLRAQQDPARPYFLILDEMNLSHVERYFADVLSSMESEEALHLHGDRNRTSEAVLRNGVPGTLAWPTNLFVIGTVNIDETTAMFSPKVLDRANVIEFRLTEIQLATYLHEAGSVRLAEISGLGMAFGPAFTEMALSKHALSSSSLSALSAELGIWFTFLSGFASEFGFRTAKEIVRFAFFYPQSQGEDLQLESIIDIQVLQKLLPKLHGSTRRLKPILLGLATLAYESRRDNEGNITDSPGLLLQAKRASTYDGMNPLDCDDNQKRLYPLSSASHPRSYEKITRMLEALEQNGFASFAEA